MRTRVVVQERVSKVIERHRKRGGVRICRDGTRDLYVVLSTQTKIQQLHVRAGFTGICVPQPQRGGTHRRVIYPAFGNDETRLDAEHKFEVGCHLLFEETGCEQIFLVAFFLQRT